MQNRLARTICAAALIATYAMSFANPAVSSAPPTAEADPYQWLEEVQGERALAWVKERNAVSQAALMARPDYAPTKAALLAVLNARDRIPYVRRIGGHVYNLWQDSTNKRGLWRRATLDEYAKPQPAWESVLDLDALGAAEKENWVWGGATCLAPAYERCLVSLSRGGADAKVVREFDLRARRFVDGGFAVPEAKTDIEWIDQDTVYIGSDFGPGSLTDSGYPRVIRQWKRGTPLAQAQTVFEARQTDVSAGVSVDPTVGYHRTVFTRAIDFYTTESFLLKGQQLVRIAKPDDASIAFHGPWLLLSLRSELRQGEQRFAAGSLLVARADAYLRGQQRLELLFEPTATRSLESYTATRSTILLNILDNVANRLEEVRHVQGRWQRRTVEAPFPGNIGVASLHDPALRADPLAERYLLTYTDFLTPDSLYLGGTGNNQRQLLKQRPPQFDTSGARAEQRFAASKDGTRVPYFVIWPQGARPDGNNPTLLYGYGGFEVSLQPWYSGSFGRAWHERGGVLVVANIRGGGEFGPGWHQSAIKADKQRSYDDFIAVAEDLVRTGVTSPARLGIQGGSNGGLLVGAVAMQRPELFNAVVCQVPLLDMRRYHKLLAGASWMAEYGDPDKPDDWAVISRYSPYQNVKREARYPTMLFTTSTRDDRVHPGHARKMVARLLELGHPVLYYENIEGGHGGAADNEQRAHLQALEFSYLWSRLGGDTPARH
jgi:prolyl oligopeptidase